MESRIRTILFDAEVPDLRGGQYSDLLRSTSWTMICLIGAHIGRPSTISIKSSRDAVRRAMTALTQLPSEWAGSDKRYDHARWRSDGVTPGCSQRLHAEHPWSKSRTKKLIIDAVEQGVSRGAAPESLVDHVSQILDARMDTVLLPSGDLRSQGIALETQGDGLARYADAVATGRIRMFDRYTGSSMTAKEIMDEDVSRERRVQSSIRKIIVG